MKVGRVRPTPKQQVVYFQEVPEEFQLYLYSTSRQLLNVYSENCPLLVVYAEAWPCGWHSAHKFWDNRLLSDVGMQPYIHS
eukprot:6720910-Prorocentrum_lima.AAC.1